MSSNQLRSNLYHFLAEALSEPPDWLALPGREWPLFEAAVQLSSSSDAARQATLALLEIDADSLEVRRQHYTDLFSSPVLTDRLPGGLPSGLPYGRPHLWIYESGALSGRLFTQDTLDVEQWYRSSGLDVVGVELPDHASLELEFLAFLNGPDQNDFFRIERAFIQQHAGRWLPQLGLALVASRDPVYGPVGQLLVDWLEEQRPRSRNLAGAYEKTTRHTRRLPVLSLDRVEDCILCGFCVHSCPFKALRILEDQQMTSLQINAKLCAGCGKCARACEPGVLALEEISPVGVESSPGWATLRHSPGVSCEICGASLVSQAEFQYVSARLGDPSWLKLCPECRSGFLVREEVDL